MVDIINVSTNNLHIKLCDDFWRGKMLCPLCGFSAEDDIYRIKNLEDDVIYIQGETMHCPNCNADTHYTQWYEGSGY